MTHILFSEVTGIFLGHSEAHSLKSGVHMFFICMHNNWLKYQMAVFYYMGPSIHVIFPTRKSSIVRAGPKQHHETIHNC